MTWQVIAQAAGTQPITAISTTQKHELGRRVRAVDPDYGEGEFQYVAGVASCAANDWVTLNPDDGSITRLSANGIGQVGIAKAAITASYYGWVQIYGKAVGNCLTQFADNGIVFATGTAGSIDDTSVAGDLVNRARGASTTVVDSGVADFELHYPFVDDRAGNT